MKRIIEDYRNERFTLGDFIVYGICCPSALIAVCVIVELI